MKKFILVILFITISLSSCSSYVAVEEYNTLLSKNNEIEKKYNDLVETYNQTNADFQTIEKDFENYKNETKDWFLLSEEEKKSQIEISKREDEIIKLDSDIENRKEQIIILNEEIENLKIEIDNETLEQQRKATEGVTIFENELIKINFIGYYLDRYDRDSIKYLVENKTNFTLTIQDRAIAFDGWDLGDGIMSDDISPQSKGYIFTSFDEGIENKSPITISGKLHVYDKNDNIKSFDVVFVNIVVK